MASDRNLTTTVAQVFGDVKCGTECRVCGRNVDDGRAKTCSDYCSNLASAVMGLLNWNGVRRRVIERDDWECQDCGFDMEREHLARDHIENRIDELAGPRPESPGLSEQEKFEEFDWDDYYDRLDKWQECRKRMKDRYGDPWDRSRRLEVDHIVPIADGGHPFDPGNLQTLCEHCHKEKTAAENSDRRQTPSREELNESLFEYVADGGVE